MTGDVSKTAREVLTGCFGFNVRFADWSTLATDIVGDTELQSELRMYDRWGELLYEFLNETSVAEIVEADEQLELALLQNALNIPLKSFGDHFVKIPGSNHDFEIRELGNKIGFLVGERKESGMLPWKYIKPCSELCLFGFATRVAEACSSTT